MDATTLIREAIAHQRFDEALRLWRAYTDEIRRALETHSLPPARMREMTELFTWSRTAVLCARAHWHDQYHALQIAASYRSSSVPDPSITV